MALSPVVDKCYEGKTPTREAAQNPGEEPGAWNWATWVQIPTLPLFAP
jgi:hypothetical protein